MSIISPLRHGQAITLIGSCFSDEIGNLLQANGFHVLVNPGGTIFHPQAISKLLRWALNDQFVPLRMYQRKDIFLSWDLSGSFYAMSEEAFIEKSKLLYENLRTSLQKSTHLLLTFGTSWAYTLGADQQIVANCHKAPKSFFEKSLTELEVLQTTWHSLIAQLQRFNSSLEVILTISPVRHLSDGLVENNRSKARLHMLVEKLAKINKCHYFEAFEIVTDQLRDYTFFKEDGAHPNQKAIQKSKAHQFLYPESMEAKQLLVSLEKQTADFFMKHPDFLDSTPA